MADSIEKSPKKKNVNCLFIIQGNSGYIINVTKIGLCVDNFLVCDYS